MGSRGKDLGGAQGVKRSDADSDFKFKESKYSIFSHIVL